MLQTLIYYGLLYFLIILVNFFKVLREKPDPSTPQPKFNWRKVFFISNEFIYTGSGIYIILLEKQHDWIPPIVAGLLLVMLISTNLDGMSDRLNDKIKFWVHIGIIVAVLVSTFLTFFNGWDKSPEQRKQQQAEEQRNKSYRVSIPYIDRTIISKIGYTKFGEKHLDYNRILTASSRDSAKIIALSLFWTDTALYPILNETASKRELLLPKEECIVIEEIK
jgi:hypothetical protein